MQMRSHLSDTGGLGKRTVQLIPSPSRISRFLSRRRFLAMGATIGALALPQAELEVPRDLGPPLRAYGDPSPFEKITRYFKPGQYPASGGTATPLQDLYGIITPSALH